MAHHTTNGLAALSNTTKDIYDTKKAAKSPLPPLTCSLTHCHEACEAYVVAILLQHIHCLAGDQYRCSILVKNVVPNVVLRLTSRGYVVCNGSDPQQVFAFGGLVGRDELYITLLPFLSMVRCAYWSNRAMLRG